MDFLFSSNSSSSSKSEQKPSSSISGGSAEDWQRRIYSLQSERLSPEQRAQHQQQQREKEARKKRIEASCKSARRLETVNYLSSTSNMCSLRAFTDPGPRGRDRARSGGAVQRQVYEEAAVKSSSRAQKIQQSSLRRATADEEEGGGEDEDLNELTIELQQEMQSMENAPVDMMSTVQSFGFMSSSERAAATSTMNSELLTLLKELEVEPSDNSELAAKFALFENFLQTVTVIREQTLAFWDENKDLFEGGTRAAAQKEVRKMDSEDSMGIHDDPRRWFVYAMTKKANDNSGKIAQTLSLLRSRLEQINSSDVGDCPFCLEDLAPLKEAGETTVLTCCHRVCTPCWQQWQQVKGARSFCPLCRSDEFVSEVLSSPLSSAGVV